MAGERPYRSAISATESGWVPDGGRKNEGSLGRKVTTTSSGPTAGTAFETDSR